MSCERGRNRDPRTVSAPATHCKQENELKVTTRSDSPLTRVDKSDRVSYRVNRPVQVDEFRREGIVFGIRLLHREYQSSYDDSAIKKYLTISFRNTSQGTKRIWFTSLWTLAASFWKPAPGSHIGMWRTEWTEIVIRPALKRSVIDRHTTWEKVQEELEKREFSAEPNGQGFLVGHKQSLSMLFR